MGGDQTLEFTATPKRLDMVRSYTKKRDEG